MKARSSGWTPCAPTSATRRSAPSPTPSSRAWTIPAKAPDPQGALKFIDFILRPDVGAQLSNFLDYATPNEASLPLIKPEVRNDSRVYPTDSQMAKMVMLEDAQEATTLYDQVWTRVKAGD